MKLAEYRIETGSFSGWDGMTLRWKAWISTDIESGRNLVFHHGFGEHIGRYENLIDAVSPDQVNLFSFDVRGHGRSDGDRGAAGDVTDMVRDLEQFLLLLRDEFGVRRPHLLGHSMGGLIVVCFCLAFSNQWEVASLLTSGAALQVKMNPLLRAKQVSGQVIGRFAPDLAMPAGIDIKLLSHDPRVAEEYENDPLVHGMLSVRLGLDMLDKGKWAIAQAPRIRIPLLMGHGASDGIADPEGTKSFFKRTETDIAELHLYPGLYHEIFNETPAARASVFDDYRRFLLRRMESDSHE